MTKRLEKRYIFMIMKNIWKFLGLTQDTIGRGRYFITNAIASFGLLVVVSWLMALSSSLFENEPVILYPLLILYLVLIVFALVVYIRTSIRRVRDIGIARSWWVLAIIPLINTPFFVYLCLKKGAKNHVADAMRKNPIAEQFKLFFSQSYSKPFLIICFSVIVAGAIYAGFSVADLKSDIDKKITQREEQIKKELTPLARSFFLNTGGTPDWVYDDALHNELRRIRETSPAQLFLQNFSFGWLGVIALVVVFLINASIVVIKLLRHFAPFVIRWGSTRVAIIKGNILKMPAFQRYFLFIALLMLITLIFILIKL